MRKTAAALVAAFFCLFATAGQEMIYRKDNLSVRLTQRACEVQAAQDLLRTVPGVTEVKAAEVILGGETRRACWGLDADNDVAVVDEKGAGGFLPVKAFQPAGV